jgi:SAM-dependent methyltransferase
MSNSSPQIPEFDRFATDYDRALAEGISVSGEDKDYFANGRVEWLAGCLHKLGCHPKIVLDYGCGTGSATPFLARSLSFDSLVGVDVSVQSLVVARQQHGSPQVKFTSVNDYKPAGSVDLVFCNGVFHHIPPKDRHDAVKFIHASLKPGAFFSFWENNPWNPGTRYVMSRIPFDRDAITLSPPEARRLLRAGGFEIVRTDFLFWFPRFLSWFRRLEKLLSPLPMGAQYHVLCRKPHNRG